MKTIAVCIKRRFDPNASCALRGSEALVKELEARIVARGLPLHVRRMVCLGMCESGPNIKVVGGDLFNGVRMDDLDAILKSALEDEVGRNQETISNERSGNP